MSKYDIDNLYFVDMEHKKRLLELLLKDNTYPTDLERLSLFYIVSSDLDLYIKFKNNLYNFEEHWIEPEGLSKIDLCGGHSRLMQLAFNLYNNYYDDDRRLTTLDIFSSLDSDNFRVALEGIKIRFNQFE